MIMSTYGGSETTFETSFCKSDLSLSAFGAFVLFFLFASTSTPIYNRDGQPLYYLAVSI